MHPIECSIRMMRGTMTAGLSSKRAQTQDRLMDAATALFAEKGVLAASVEEICERAGFTRGAFYSNFDSKDELMLAVLERQSETILVAASEAIASVPDEYVEPNGVDEVIEQALMIFEITHPTDSQWLMASTEIRLHAIRNPAVREALQSVDASLDAVLVAGIREVLARQDLHLKVSPEQLVVLLAAYKESLSIRSLLAGAAADSAPSTGHLVTLIRALIEDR